MFSLLNKRRNYINSVVSLRSFESVIFGKGMRWYFFGGGGGEGLFTFHFFL